MYYNCKRNASIYSLIYYPYLRDKREKLLLGFEAGLQSVLNYSLVCYPDTLDLGKVIPKLLKK